MKSNFIVSLDFELIWGMHEGDVVNSDYVDNIRGGRQAIPRLLSLFKEYDIHATWAVVGLLFADNLDDAKGYFPHENSYPTYKNINMSPYPLMETIENQGNDLYFAPDIISKISAIPYQEIASHTFCHYYCMEDGQNVAQFEADMKSAKEIALRKGYNLTSVVFPRNQCKKEYVDVLAKLGFTAYRDDSSDWLHKKIKLRPLLRAMRLLDVYFPITGNKGNVHTKENGITKTVGTRMFRPYFKPLSILEPLKIKRIKKQMLYAAKHGEDFHLWWHPHNVGVRTDYHLKVLKDIFEYYKFLEKKYGMQSKNMSELAE